MNWEYKFRDLMRAELERRQLANPKYSMRAFARDIEFSVGGISNVFSGRLSISAKRAAGIAGKFHLSTIELNNLKIDMGLPVERESREVSKENFSIFSHWSYLAILHFFDLTSEQPSAAEIGGRLAISDEQISETIEKLISMNFLTREADGSITKPNINWKTGDGPSIEILRRHHLENCDLSKRAFLEIPKERRHFANVTFPGNPELLDKVREEFYEFQNKVCGLMEGVRPLNEVYRMSLNIFPMNFSNETPSLADEKNLSKSSTL